MKAVITILLIIAINSANATECIDTAFAEFEKHKYQNTIDILMECEDEVKYSEDPEEMSKYYYGIGVSYLELGILDSALKYQQISFDIKKSFNLEENLSNSFNDIGIILYRKGLFHKSIYYLKKAIENNIKYGNEKFLSVNYNNLANSYRSLDKLDSAFKYYNLGLNYLNKDNVNSEFNIYNNLGVLNQESGNYERSKEYFKKALNNLQNKTKEDSLLSITNFEIVGLFEGKYISPEPLKTYLEYFSSIEGNYALYDAYFKLSLYYLSLNEKQIAFNYFVNSISVLEENNNYYRALELVESYKEIADRFNIELDNFSSIINISNNLSDKLNETLTAEYAKEIEYRLYSENKVSELEKDVYQAEMSFYITALLILSFISTFGIVLVWGWKKKIVQKIISRIQERNKLNNQNFEKIQVDLVKLMFIIDDTKGLKHKEYILELINDAINNSNSIDLKKTDFLLNK